MMKVAFVLLVGIHLLIHSLGFIKAFKLADIATLTHHISGFQGILWICSAVLFLIMIVLFAVNNNSWIIVAIPAIILSQVLITMNWSDSKYGSLVNLIILGVAVVSIANRRFESTYKKDVTKAITAININEEVIEEQDLRELPEIIRKYMRHAGVVGKPRIYNMKITFEGEMREKGKDWFSFRSEQYNFIENPGRYFFMKANFKGLPTRGYHSFTSSEARMQIKPLSLFEVVDLKKPELFPTEMVTFLNDLCLFAPAALIDKRINWQEIDEHSVKAIFRINDTEVSATLKFNKKGELINFISEDRYAIDIMKKIPFSTPVKNYRNINGLNLPTYGEAIWQYPEGEFVYGKFNLVDLEYNLPQLN